MDDNLLRQILTGINEIKKSLIKVNSNWLDFHEAALYLKISESTLRKYVASGMVPFNRIGVGNKNKFLFSRRQLDLWIIYGKKTFTKRELQKLKAFID